MLSLSPSRGCRKEPNNSPQAAVASILAWQIRGGQGWGYADCHPSQVAHRRAYEASTKGAVRDGLIGHDFFLFVNKGGPDARPLSITVTVGATACSKSTLRRMSKA